MDKYYTPRVEEFYVGFRYESIYNDDWIQDQITQVCDIPEDDLEHNDGLETKVKYLDKEDIESLGFIQTIKDQYYKDDFELLIDDDLFIQIIKDDGFVFQGTIKNKSELIILLKQLGINE